MTAVRIPAQAVQLQHLHPKVTARALGGIAFTASPSAPGSPNQGDLWSDTANYGQLSQWTGSQWAPVPIGAGSLIGENFNISPTGQFHYQSPPAYTTWSFEAGLQGWTAANASIAPSPAWSQDGDYSALLTYQSGASWSAASPPQAVTPGAQVFAAAWVYAPQALGAVGLQLAWRNSAGTLLSTSSQATSALAAATAAQLSYNATAPASAATVQIVVQDAETSVTGYGLFVDEVYIAGPLAVAIAPASGSDQLANTHPAGLYTAGNYGTGLVMSAGSALESVPGSTGVTARGTGTGTQLGTGLSGPAMTGGVGYADTAAVVLFSSQEGSPETASGTLYYTSGAGAQSELLAWGAAGVTTYGLLNVNAGLATAASSLTGGVIISQCDNLYTSQPDPTSMSRLTKVWPIPEGDPVQGTVYRLSTFGTGVWQGNPLSFQIAALGEKLAPFTVGGALMNAGLSFMFDLTATLIITQTGSGGILSASIRLNLAASGANQLPGGGASGSGGFVGAGNYGPLSGIGGSGTTMAVQVSFGASSSSQSIQSIGSIFERIGGVA